ncbi:MAG: nucleotidyltransferase domain-containing protein [Bacteroidota bacterium]|jgi:predicted nucleotidyltransferase
MDTKKTIVQCRQVLETHYGAKLRGVLLYGSLARKTSNPASDIDLLVLLNKPFDYFGELRRLVDLLYPLQLECERFISAKPAPYDEYEAGRIQLYRTAKREGTFV